MFKSSQNKGLNAEASTNALKPEAASKSLNPGASNNSLKPGPSVKSLQPGASVNSLKPGPSVKSLRADASGNSLTAGPSMKQDGTKSPMSPKEDEALLKEKSPKEDDKSPKQDKSRTDDKSKQDSSKSKQDDKETKPEDDDDDRSTIQGGGAAGGLSVPHDSLQTRRPSVGGEWVEGNAALEREFFHDINIDDIDAQVAVSDESILEQESKLFSVLAQKKAGTDKHSFHKRPKTQEEKLLAIKIAMEELRVTHYSLLGENYTVRNFWIFVLCYGMIMLMRTALSFYMFSIKDLLQRRYFLTYYDANFVHGCQKVGFVASLIFVSYYGNRLHKPGFILFGAIAAAFGGILCILPQFVTCSVFNTDVVAQGPEFINVADNVHVTLCKGATWSVSDEDDRWHNGTCLDDFHRVSPGDTNPAMVLFCLGTLLLGLGSASMATLGFVYIDEAGDREMMPVMIGVTLSLNGLGELLGVMLHRVTGLNRADDVSIDGIHMGKYWVAIFLLSLLLALFGLTMLLFPRFLTEPRWLLLRKLKLKRYKEKRERHHRKMEEWLENRKQTRDVRRKSRMEMKSEDEKTPDEGAKKDGKKKENGVDKPRKSMFGGERTEENEKKQKKGGGKNSEKQNKSKATNSSPSKKKKEGETSPKEKNDDKSPKAKGEIADKESDQKTDKEVKSSNSEPTSASLSGSAKTTPTKEKTPKNEESMPKNEENKNENARSSSENRTSNNDTKKELKGNRSSSVDKIKSCVSEQVEKGKSAAENLKGKRTNAPPSKNLKAKSSKSSVHKSSSANSKLSNRTQKSSTKKDSEKEGLKVPRSSESKESGLDHKEEEQDEAKMKAMEEEEKQAKRKRLGRKLKDLPRNLWYLMTHWVFVLPTLACCMSLYLQAGFYPLVPYYLQNHFQYPIINAAEMAGVLFGMSQCIGPLLAAYVIWEFKMPIQLQYKICLLCLVGTCVCLCLLFPLTCQLKFYDQGESATATGAIDASCWGDSCHCEAAYPYFICTEEGKAFTSPCHAGCNRINETKNALYYSDCKCLENKATALSANWCQSNCPAMGGFGFMLFLAALTQAFTHVTAVTTFLRVVPEKMRSLSLGFALWLGYLIAQVPGVAVFEGIAGNACTQWLMDASDTNMCWRYNLSQHRYSVVGTCLVSQILAIIFLVPAYFKVRDYEIEKAAEIQLPATIQPLDASIEAQGHDNPMGRVAEDDTDPHEDNVHDAGENAVVHTFI